MFFDGTDSNLQPFLILLHLFFTTLFQILEHISMTEGNTNNVASIATERATVMKRPKYLIGVNDAKSRAIIPATIETVVRMIGLPVSSNV